MSECTTECTIGVHHGVHNWVHSTKAPTAPRPERTLGKVCAMRHLVHYAVHHTPQVAIPVEALRVAAVLVYGTLAQVRSRPG